MVNFKSKKENAYKDWLYKLLLFFGTVAVIVYFLPRDGKFNYQFDLNTPWKYGQLMATFDFPIYKDANLVQREQDSILAHFQPYYQLNKQVEQEALKRWKNEYQGQYRKMLPSADYQRHIERKLSEIYRSGIVSSEDMDRLHRDSTSALLVIHNKLASQQVTSRLFTVKEAYNYLLTADTLHYAPRLLRKCSLNEYLLPNLIYDEQRTEQAKKELLDNYSWATGLVLSGQKIVDRGEIITPHTYNILESLRKESDKRSEIDGQQGVILLGQFIYVGTFILCFMVFLELFRKDYYQNKRHIALLFALIIFFSVITSLMVKNAFLSVYILPYAMLPIMIRVFLDSRTALFAHIVTLLICAICLRYPFEFILLQITVGLVSIFSLQELSQRSQLFQATLILMFTYAALYFAYELITVNDFSKINWGMYTNFVLNALLLLFVYPLLFLVEKTFGFTSNVTLVELSNINNNLLRRMAETVPGTFQHSMQVANLAAEAANAIHADSQLVRTGALYHDIGKMENPVFFTENQLGGVNPHKQLNYEQSAQIIISHVTNGLKLAEKHSLPKVLKDFILTHHGHGKTKYFYISWKNEHPGETPDEEWFTYPGPNPYTREQAILMMADAIEAASRSLSEYTEESIGALIEKIIDDQVAEGFFKECPITFKDIATIKGVFKEKLMTMYHTRISYPELKK